MPIISGINLTDDPADGSIRYNNYYSIISENYILEHNGSHGGERNAHFHWLEECQWKPLKFKFSNGILLFVITLETVVPTSLINTL